MHGLGRAWGSEPESVNEVIEQLVGQVNYSKLDYFTSIANFWYQSTTDDHISNFF